MLSRLNRRYVRVKSLAPMITIVPALLLYLLFLFLPTVGNFFFSLTDFNGNIHRIEWLGLDNYIRAFTSDSGRVLSASKTTIVFTLGVVSLQNVAGLSLALAANSPGRFRDTFKAVIFSPAVLGVIVVGLAWRLLLDPRQGPVNRILRLVDAQSALLGEPKIALLLIILIQVWMYAGYSMVIYLAGLRSIPVHLYESAHIDGANTLQILRYITLPLLQPVITINILLSLIGALNTYDIIVVLTNGGPVSATTTLPLYIFKMVAGGATVTIRHGTLGYAAALSLLHFVLVALLVLALLVILRTREVTL